MLNLDKRPHELPDRLVKERAERCFLYEGDLLERGAYLTASDFGVNDFFLPFRRFRSQTGQPVGAEVEAYSTYQPGTVNRFSRFVHYSYRSS